MPEIDNEQLTSLIEVCKQAYPDVDPYIIWVYSMDYLLMSKEYMEIKMKVKNYLKKHKGN